MTMKCSNVKMRITSSCCLFEISQKLNNLSSSNILKILGIKKACPVLVFSNFRDDGSY